MVARYTGFPRFGHPGVERAPGAISNASLPSSLQACTSARALHSLPPAFRHSPPRQHLPFSIFNLPSSSLTAMDQQLEQLRTEALAAIAGAADETAVEQARIKYLGQSGTLTVVSK